MANGLKLTVVEDVFPVAGTFTISRGSRTEIRVVTVSLSDGVHVGQGECVPYARYGETVDGVIEAILGTAEDLERGLDRAALQTRLPPGAARNALDCALWDLEAKRAARPVWQLAGLSVPKPIETAFTLSLGTPESMREAAAKNADRPLLKVKLGTDDDLGRIEAVRAGAPNARIIVDANEGWTVAQYLALAPALVRLGVALVEQPLPAGQDDVLAGIERVLPVCADESCHDRASLAHLVGKYDAINIKLDKTGGLTEALLMREAAVAAGFDIMVGCMLGTSLAMAPAFLVAQGASFADLDGPLLIAADRVPPIRYVGSIMQVPEPALWG
ncbi:MULTISPECIES: N-acetyl-D-Glu racemase DgcA [Alphaproteobacteria]|uniref:Dipeptide epimerase n=2 Tax=Alphaproteobacteria TaxID=28211 RepID=A0A512HJP8_9HYPH|nr:MULTISPECIES: N-acetyl-D-Glu racemase DgcA [Alphaproteobacteria]GEO85672.1 dipeptide epimerase [Ciceribacter naphthalenivorans]GLR21973.1 dipeptide epimerase [Ciceribacter naphthalenivorans]GLT04829.1 dipeptide epimerase [Sphingomonas psychrolutea]